MKRRAVVQLLVGAAAMWRLASHAQQASKSYRVGFLALTPGEELTIIKRRLGELGYTEGRNLIFDLRSADGDSTRLAPLAAELVRAKCDVIVAGFGTLTAKALQAATNTIPVVFATVGDPLGTGLVQSLSRPGANITGVTTQTGATGIRRIQLLEQVVPGVRTAALLLNPDTPFSALALKEWQGAASARKIRLNVLEIRAAEQLPSLIAAAVKGGASALLLVEDPLTVGLRREIAELTTKAHLPGIFGYRRFVEAGGLMSYGADRRANYRRAAEMVDKVLKGTKPADIPVEQSAKFELVINLKAAKALRITVPQSLLATADEVIE